MAAACVLTLLPWVLDAYLLRINKKRDAELAKLTEEHVFPDGPVSHLDGKCITILPAIDVSKD